MLMLLSACTLYITICMFSLCPHGFPPGSTVGRWVVWPKKIGPRYEWVCDVCFGGILPGIDLPGYKYRTVAFCILLNIPSVGGIQVRQLNLTASIFWPDKWKLKLALLDCAVGWCKWYDMTSYTGLSNRKLNPKNRK